MAEKIRISVEDHSPLTEHGLQDSTADSNADANSCSGETLSVDGGRFNLHKCGSFPRIQGNTSLTASRTTLCTLETISPRVSTENINDEYTSLSEGAGLLVRSFSDKSMDSLPPLDCPFRCSGSGGLLPGAVRNGKQVGYHRSTSCPSMHKGNGVISPTRSPGTQRLGHLSRKEANVKCLLNGQEGENIADTSENEVADSELDNHKLLDSSHKRHLPVTKKRPISDGSGKYVNVRDLNTDLARQVISGFETSHVRSKVEQESRQKCEEWLNTIDTPDEEEEEI